MRKGFVHCQKGSIRAQRKFPLSLRCKQFHQVRLKAIEKGFFECEACDHIFACHRQKAWLHLTRIEGRIIIHAISIGFCNGARLWCQSGVIARVNRFPHTKKRNQIIGHRRVNALDRGKLSARGDCHLLHGREIIFRLGKTQTEGHIRVAHTINVGDTKLIPVDGHFIG